MASGSGFGEDVDSRMTCSVCLEPYRGRQPKLLPCFHTFCLPCLSQLAEREARQSVMTGSEDSRDNERVSPVSLTCPTCRTAIPVPPGGVAQFQANFYLDACIDKGEHQPLPCNLCDGVQDAKFRCSKCEKCFCRECRRYHDKLCQAAQVTELQDPVISPRGVQSPAGGQHKQQVQMQLQMVEDVLKKLVDEEKKVNQERRAIEQDIHVFYATLLRHGAEARDASLVSLRDVSEGVTERLQSHMTQARRARDKLLQQQLSSSQPASVTLSASQVNTVLCEVGDLQAKLKDNSSSILKHKRRDDSKSLVDCLRSFMGTVVESSLTPDPKATDSPARKQSLENPEGTAKNFQQQLDEMNKKLNMLQSAHIQLTQCTNETNSKLSQHISKTSTQFSDYSNETNKRLSAVRSSLQQEISSLRDKYAVLQQDVAALTAENDKLRQEQAHIKGVRDDCVAVQKGLKKTQGDVTFLQQTVRAVQDSLQDSATKVAELTTKICKLTTPVAFHAELDKTVTIRTARVLFMKNIITNIGDGYNGQTGVFTAPVSGTYCFMATANPGKEGAVSRFEMILDDQCIAYIWSKDYTSCSCHTAVKVSAGQKVFLRTYDDEEPYQFCGPGPTSFSGMLLQPDLL